MKGERMKPIRTAIIGFGGMGKWHAEKLNTLSEIELVGTFDIKETQQQAAADMNLFPYDNFEAMLADESLELVTIATPNDLHKPQAIRLMDAGKHVICEKPVTICSADLEAMIAASERNGVLFTVHQNRRWDKDFLIVKKLVQEKHLGNVFCVESRVHGSRGIPGDWRNKKAHGGGMVLDWGVHLLDQLLILGGQVDSIYAELTYITNEEADDGFIARLVFKNGLRAHVEVGTSNFVSLPRWYVTGVNGTAVIENWQMDGKIVMVSDWEKRDAVPVNTAAGFTKTMAPRGKDTIQTYPLPTIESDVRDFYRNVASVIRNGSEPIVTHQQQRELMQLIEAVIRSAETGKIVKLNQNPLHHVCTGDK